jgi:phage terminase large subunit
VPLTRADNRRVQGWYALREWLSPDDRGEPRLRIFKNCRNLIRCLPQLCHDDKNPEDVAADPHELTHGPDALRYFVAGRPAPGRVAPRAQWQWGAAATRADPAGRGDRVRVI